MQTTEKRDFDAAAAGWDEEPRRLQLAGEVVAAIRREVPLSAQQATLDYGCGTGLVTLGLKPLVGRITAADSSRGMLEVLKNKLSAGGIGTVETYLIDPEQQERLPGSYDLIVSSMTMHHVADVPRLVSLLAGKLNPGGWLAIADLEQEDGSFHGDVAGVFHHGFARDFFFPVYADCALTDQRAVVASVVEKEDGAGGKRSYPVILWLARKPV